MHALKGKTTPVPYPLEINSRMGQVTQLSYRVQADRGYLLDIKVSLG